MFIQTKRRAGPRISITSLKLSQRVGTLRRILEHEEPHKVPLLIILSDGCYAQFPVIILPPISCMLAGIRLAVIGSDLHRGDETILNFATVC